MKRVTRPRGGRTHFYADENVDAALVGFMRTQGYRIDSAVELGLSPRDDRFHLQEAKRRKALLLTNDTDFLNDREFPFNNLHDTAIVVMRTDEKAPRMTRGYMLFALLDHVAPSGNHNLHGLKIELRGPVMALRAQRDGAVRSYLFDLSKPFRDGKFVDKNEEQPEMAVRRKRRKPRPGSR